MDLRERITWDTYFMNIAEEVKERSTCVRKDRQIGAVIARGTHVISTGYNGAPEDCKHCLDLGCLRDELNIASGTHHEICRAVHAEQNAIIQCGLNGVSSEGSIIYITAQPCIICAKMIINARISRVVYKGEYPDKLALDLLGEAGIEVVKL